MLQKKKIELKEVFTEIKEFLGSPVRAVETGCSFLWLPECMTNLSTPNIINHLFSGPSDFLLSIDNDKDHVYVCSNELEIRGLLGQVSFCVRESLEALNHADKCDWSFNFAWLDSSEDEQHGLDEYNTVKKLMKFDKFVIAIDDYGADGSVKWRKSSDVLKKEASFWKKYNTPTGLIVGFYEG